MISLYANRLNALRAREQLRPALVAELELLKTTIHPNKSSQDTRMRILVEEIATTANNNLTTVFLLEAVPFLNEHHSTEVYFMQEENNIKQKRAAAIDQGEDASVVELDAALHNLCTDRCNTFNRICRSFVAKFYPNQSDAKREVQDLRINQDCPDCGAGVDVGRSIEVCSQSCGFSRSVLILNDTDHCSYEDGQRTQFYQPYTYKPVNHFREELKRVQGVCTSILPADVHVSLNQELLRCRSRPETITPTWVRQKLKKLGFSQFYEHSVSIASQLNPTFHAIHIPPEREEKLCQMFLVAEPAYQQIKRQVQNKRKNFLSYNFIAFKLCELLLWKQYQPAFTLLKSRQLLIEQDRFWKRVCHITGWNYINTIGNVHCTDSKFI